MMVPIRLMADGAIEICTQFQSSGIGLLKLRVGTTYVLRSSPFRQVHVEFKFFCGGTTRMSIQTFAKHFSQMSSLLTTD